MLERVRAATSVCVYLLAVSQVLRFYVPQRLPVGVAAPAATLHLCQRLSFQGVALLVIPVRNKMNE